jgi:chromosome segregation ATPase
VFQPDCTSEVRSIAAQSQPADEETGLKVTLADYQDLLNELAQAHSLDKERVARIRQLEQALDQALACLDDLKLQVHNQATLEEQLATTEAFASVQTQAIAQFKLQLKQQQQALEAQLALMQRRDRTLYSLLDSTESLTLTQQQELEKLRSRIVENQVEVQAHRRSLEQQLQNLTAALESRHQRVVELESEALAARTHSASLEGQLNAAQQKIKELSTSLGRHQASLSQLAAQLEQAKTALDQRQSPQVTLPPIAPSVANPDLNKLQQELALSKVKTEELGIQLAKRTESQARWQHHYYEVQAERDRYQSRLADLEQQTAEMQEQILQQAKQSSEYETAIQHWKERHDASQQHLAQIKALIEQAADQQGGTNAESMQALLTELLAAIQGAIVAETPEVVPLSPNRSSRFHALDLPNFLIRRSYRAKWES